MATHSTDSAASRPKASVGFGSRLIVMPTPLARGAGGIMPQVIHACFGALAPSPDMQVMRALHRHAARATLCSVVNVAVSPVHAAVGLHVHVVHSLNETADTGLLDLLELPCLLGEE